MGQPWSEGLDGGWQQLGRAIPEQFLSNDAGQISWIRSSLAARGSSFDDSKASWGLNRHISARCGQTFTDTFNFWRKEFPADDPIPFVMIETWNDYEEGTAIEHGIPTCDKLASSSSK